MQIESMSIPGAFRLTPHQIRDERGSFYEAFRVENLVRRTGHSFDIRQGNFTVSRRGTIRGVHGTRVPPGQAKLVTCVRGSALDVVVDLRAGSPTFGAFEATVLTEDAGTLVFLEGGLGHAYQTLVDDTRMSYLCGKEFVPGTQIDICPLDPALALPWHPGWDLIISDKDRRAPSLDEAARSGILPRYADCLGAAHPTQAP